jgi:hypothetical protein
VLPPCMSCPSSHFLPSFTHHYPSSSSASYIRERLALTTSGLATLGTNISTNSIATSNDFAFLFPKYLNIKRGAFITSILGGWVTCPWQIQKSAQSLTTFLSGYVIVLAPLLAIMVSLFLLFLLPFTFFPLLHPSSPLPSPSLSITTPYSESKLTFRLPTTTSSETGSYTFPCCTRTKVSTGTKAESTGEQSWHWSLSSPSISLD